MTKVRLLFLLAIACLLAFSLAGFHVPDLLSLSDGDPNF